MCLAVPGRIVSLEGDAMASVDFSGVTRDVSLALVPAAREGDHVLVHAGFAIEVVSEEDALETRALLEELAAAAASLEPAGRPAEVARP